jgi:hypothetical protein
LQGHDAALLLNGGHHLLADDAAVNDRRTLFGKCAKHTCQAGTTQRRPGLQVPLRHHRVFAELNLEGASHRAERITHHEALFGQTKGGRNDLTQREIPKTRDQRLDSRGLPRDARGEAT